MKEDFNGHTAGKLVTLDYVEAHQAENQRKGVIVGGVDEIERQITEAVDRYKREYKAMTESNDPVYKVEGVIDYYTEKMRAKLEEEVGRLTDHWKGVYGGMKEAATAEAARLRHYITESERESAKQHATKIVNALKFGGDTSVLAEAIRLAPRMTNGQKLVLMDEMGRIEGAAGGKHDAMLRSLYAELSSVITDDHVPIKIVEALGNWSVDSAYRILRLTHRTYKHISSNVHSGRRPTSAISL